MANPLKIKFIKASWHAEIVDQSLVGFSDAMADAQIDVESVPGAFEMPLVAKRAALTGRYDAVVCAAFVVDGGIYRHDFVSQAVVSGLMQVGLETDVPVMSVSLTPHHFQETPEHMAFFKSHFVKKGAEAAVAVRGMTDQKLAVA